MTTLLTAIRESLPEFPDARITLHMHPATIRELRLIGAVDGVLIEPDETVPVGRWEAYAQ